MIQTKLKGMGVALITPFKEDESVDYDALIRLVDYQLQNNTDFLCVLGTTAETPTLTEEEKKKIKKMVIERVNGRIPILLGVGGNNTRAIVDTLQNDDFTGVDAILSVVPYYNKPSQEGIYQHYKAIAEATELPIVLYNVPGRTGVNMKAETTLRIARDFKNVIAIKEASGDITQMDDIIKNKPANFDVISGDDGITFPLITLGAVGIISVIGALSLKHLKLADTYHQRKEAQCTEIVSLAQAWYNLWDVEGESAFEYTMSIDNYPLELYNQMIVDKFCIPKQYSKRFILSSLDHIIMPFFKSAKKRYSITIL